MTTPLGNAPQHVHLVFRRTDAPSTHQPIGGTSLSFQVENGSARLQAGEQQCLLPDWQGHELQLLWMFPAKGAGFCELSLFDLATGRFTCQLLSGAFADLSWLKGTGELIARALKIDLREVDMGGDC